jgi:hypothetical protein
MTINFEDDGEIEGDDEEKFKYDNDSLLSSTK